GYRPMDDDRFTWSPPSGCENDMHGVLEAVSTRDAPDLAPVAARFQARVKAANLSALQAAELIVAFVQGIHYEIPKEPFGLMPPALVVAEKRGDCDSKSLLGLIL